MAPVLVLLGAALAGPHTAMVGVDGPAGEKAVRHVALAAGGQVRCWTAVPLCIVDLPAAPDVAALAALPGVRYAEADRQMDLGPQGDEAGTDACPDLWELERIRLTDAWAEIGSQGSGFPVVAIEDSGFLTSHVDLIGQVSGRWDYGDGDSVPDVSWGAGVPAHGTFIGGIIAGRADNGQGRAGVVPQGRLNLQKIADSAGSLYYSYAVAAMLDLADGDLGVGVLNYSIASTGTTTAFDEAIQAVGDTDILFVTAAGNCASPDCSTADNDQHPLYPPNSPGGFLLSVAGTTREDDLNPYSHYGAQTVDLAAPGVDICSLGVGSDTDTCTAGGTSYAAPLVAGVAALVRGASPDLTAVETARILRASAVDVPALEGRMRAGRLDALNAVRAPMPRLDAPDALNSSPRAQMTLVFDNVAAAGAGILVIEHGDGLGITGSQGLDDWGQTTVQAGESLTLPDAGAVSAVRRTTVLSGPLAARAEHRLDLSWVGREVGEHPVTVRLIAQSDGVDYLNAPYDAGLEDGTGFLAWSFVIVVDEAAPEQDSAAPSDSGAIDDTGPGGGEAELDPAEPGGCGCTAAPVAAPLLALVPLLLAAGRRRTPR